jgi:hypothetical protein
MAVPNAAAKNPATSKTAFSQRGESGQTTPGGLVFGIVDIVYNLFERPARLGAGKRG